MPDPFIITQEVDVVNAIYNVDRRKGPYATVELACIGVPLVLRKVGREVGIIGPDGDVIDYYWKYNTTDAGLVPKIPSLDTSLITKFTSNPIPSIVGTDILVPEDETWLIDSVPYTNPIVSTIPFSYASDGLLYFLTVVATKFNTFIGKIGTASTDPSEPTVNNDELFLTTYLISDGTVDVVVPPVSPNIYVEKSFSEPQIHFGNTPVGSIGMGKKATLVISGTVPSVECVIKNNSNDYFIGQPFYTINKTPNPLKFTHLSEAANANAGSIAWFGPTDKDYYARPNEVTAWVLDYIGSQKIHRYVGKHYISSPTIEFTPTTANLKDKAVTLEKLQEIPSGTFFGRYTTGFGQPELLDAFDILNLLGLQNVTSQIAAIQAILGSDDVNLDTLQEIIDAIKDIDTYLSTILVNNLTSGGTTKALTAEMGKTLKLALDALALVVAGKANDSEVVKLTTAQTIDGVKTFTASPIVPNATTSNQAVNLGQLKNLVKSISITDIIPHTGTTASTKVAELVIPANTILDNEIWEIEYCVTRDATNATGTVSLNIYIDGAETESNAFVRGLTFPAGNYYRSKGLRTLFFKNGKVRRFNNSGGFITDNGSMQFNAISDIDLTIENKLIINFSLAVSTDTANLEYVIFKKIN